MSALMHTTTSMGLVSDKAPLTLKELAEIIKRIPAEPYAEYMKSQGFSPRDYTLLLPMSIKPEGRHVPAYVRFSPFVEEGRGYFVRSVESASFFPKKAFAEVLEWN